MAEFDERLQINFTLIDFLNNQKTAKSKIIFTFQEVEQKPFILTFEAPNPYMSRLEMINELKIKIDYVVNEISEKKRYDILDKARQPPLDDDDHE